MLFVIKATAGLHCHKYPLHRRELPYSYTKYASLWVIWGYIYYGYQTTRPLAAAYMIYHSHAQLCSTLSWSNYPQHYVSVFSFYLHVTRLCVLLFSLFSFRLSTIWHGPEKIYRGITGSCVYFLLLFMCDVIQENGRRTPRTPEECPHNTCLGRAPAWRPRNTWTPEYTFWVNVCVCVWGIDYGFKP